MKMSSYERLKAQLGDSQMSIGQAQISQLEGMVGVLARRERRLLAVSLVALVLVLACLSVSSMSGIQKSYAAVALWASLGGLVTVLGCGLWALPLMEEVRETSASLEVLTAGHRLCGEAFSAQQSCPDASRLAASLRERGEPLRVFHARLMVRMAAQHQCRLLHGIAGASEA